MKFLKYSQFTLQSYFLNGNMKIDDMRKIFLFRVRMCKFSANFPGNNNCRLCPLCSNHPDKQELISDCEIIRNKFINVKEIVKTVYSENVTEEMGLNLVNIIRFREENS